MCNTSSIDARYYASSCNTGASGIGDSCQVVCAQVGQDGVTNAVPATCQANGQYVVDAVVSGSVFLRMSSLPSRSLSKALGAGL